MPSEVNPKLVTLTLLNNREVMYINPAPFDDREYLRTDGMGWGGDHPSPRSCTVSDKYIDKSATTTDGDEIAVFWPAR